jgi:hypothetical protein
MKPAVELQEGKFLHPRNNCVASYRLIQCDGFAASVGHAS